MNYTNFTTVLTTENDEFSCRSGMYLVRLIFEVYLTVPVTLLGIVGNILGFIAWHRQPSTSAGQLFKTLAVTDIILLILGIIVRSIRYIDKCIISWPAYYRSLSYIFIVLNPCVYIARLLNTWITTLLTINRWLAVCQPLQLHRSVLSYSVTAQNCVIILICIIFSLPRCFEYELKYGEHVSVLPTDFSENKIYTISYKIVLFLMFMYIVPMAIQIILNTKLLLALKKGRSYITRMDENSMNKRYHSSNNSTTFIVISVVILFLLCDTPPLISHCMYSLEIAFPKIKKQLEIHRRYMANFNNFMVTLNSSVHFFIYYICSVQFRLALKGGLGRNTQGSAKVNSTGSSCTTYMSGKAHVSSFSRHKASTSSIQRPVFSVEEAIPLKKKIQA